MKIRYNLTVSNYSPIFKKGKREISENKKLPRFMETFLKQKNPFVAHDFGKRRF